ncbi:MAG: hypothetical protein M1834_006208 [Cirrosporium novae-zelandiae]|nr:MAG: hypothetical protein M1834_006208 [Cirrosporium novae-zelandiae]
MAKQSRSLLVKLRTRFKHVPKPVKKLVWQNDLKNAVTYAEFLECRQTDHTKEYNAAIDERDAACTESLKEKVKDLKSIINSLSREKCSQEGQPFPPFGISPHTDDLTQILFDYARSLGDKIEQSADKWGDQAMVNVSLKADIRQERLSKEIAVARLVVKLGRTAHDDRIKFQRFDLIELERSELEEVNDQLEKVSQIS